MGACWDCLVAGAFAFPQLVPANPQRVSQGAEEKRIKEREV
jgi:hypothetical protein